jgi:hypothetical protein
LYGFPKIDQHTAIFDAFGGFHKANWPFGTGNFRRLKIAQPAILKMAG